jgi:hypothetical protein
MDASDWTVAVGSEEGVLIFDTRKYGSIVEKLKIGKPARHLAFSPRTLTAWTASGDGGEVKAWDSEGFTVLGASALNVEISCVSHGQGDGQFHLAFGARRPRKFNRGDASILCLVTEPVTREEPIPIQLIASSTPGKKSSGKRRGS